MTYLTVLQERMTSRLESNYNEEDIEPHQQGQQIALSDLYKTGAPTWLFPWTRQSRTTEGRASHANNPGSWFSYCMGLTLLTHSQRSCSKSPSGTCCAYLLFVEGATADLCVVLLPLLCCPALLLCCTLAVCMCMLLRCFVAAVVELGSTNSTQFVYYLFFRKKRVRTLRVTGRLK